MERPTVRRVNRGAVKVRRRRDDKEHAEKIHRRHVSLASRLILGLKQRRIGVALGVLRIGLILAAILGLISVIQRQGSGTIFATRGTSLRPPPARDSTPYPTFPTSFLIPKNIGGKQIWKEAGYQTRPRVMGYYFRDEDDDESEPRSLLIGAERLEPNLQRRLTHRVMDVTQEELDAQKGLGNSRDYRHGRMDKFEKNGCKAQYQWQKQSFPTCNTVHEQDLTNLHADSSKDVQVGLIANGYWRDVWMVTDSTENVHAFKTLRYEHKWEERNFDRHRRDAVAMERLTSATTVVDIYGFCGNSGMFQFADGGDIERIIWHPPKGRQLVPQERLVVAYQVAAAIADVHGFAGEIPAIVHTDITPSQFVFTDGVYKLNDFNRARFVTWDAKRNTTCGFHVGNNPGTFRSPEEYERDLETEKIDVYSMSNIFYSLLTELWPFRDEEEKTAQRHIKEGKRPTLPKRILETKDPSEIAILKAMKMGWEHKPEKRPTAKAIADFLDSELSKLVFGPNSNVTEMK